MRNRPIKPNSNGSLTRARRDQVELQAQRMRNAIKGLAIVRRLNATALGRDTMTATEVRAAALLLGKLLPDAAELAVTIDAGENFARLLDIMESRQDELDSVARARQLAAESSERVRAQPRDQAGRLMAPLEHAPGARQARQDAPAGRALVPVKAGD